MINQHIIKSRRWIAMITKYHAYPCNTTISIHLSRVSCQKGPICHCMAGRALWSHNRDLVGLFHKSRIQTFVCLIAMNLKKYKAQKRMTCGPSCLDRFPDLQWRYLHVMHIRHMSWCGVTCQLCMRFNQSKNSTCTITNVRKVAMKGWSPSKTHTCPASASVKMPP